MIARAFVCIVAVLTFVSAAAGHVSLPTNNGVGSIISITALELETMMNYMVLYPANNASVYAKQADYPYYEFTTAGALDMVRGRYLVMYESERIGYYNLSTLEKIGELVLPDAQIPDAMHYDDSTDLVWLVIVNIDNFQFCSVDNQGNQNCFGQTAGHYSYTWDTSVFDQTTGKIYVQLSNMDTMKNGRANEQPLFIFDIATQLVTGPIPLWDLCQEMEIAVIGDKRLLVCSDFIFNTLVSVDPTSGKMTKIAAFNGTPVQYTACTDNTIAGRSTYYVQLEGLAGTQRWTAWDVASGKQLFNTSVANNWQLAMNEFIPA